MEEEALELDPDILQRENTTTSVEDLYGYSVFSEEFQEQIQRYEKREKEEQDASFGKVLAGERADETELAFEKVFAAESVTVVKEEHEKQESSPMGFLPALTFTLIGMLLAGGVWLFIERIRKKKHPKRYGHAAGKGEASP